MTETLLILILIVMTFGAQQSLDRANLLLTEVYYNTPGIDAEQEWIELANIGNEIIDLSDYKLGDEESIWGGEGMFRFPRDAFLDPGQVVVVAQTAIGYRALYGRDPDYELIGSIPDVPDMRSYPLWSSGDLALANDGDEVILLDSQNHIVDSINYGDKQTYFIPSIGDVYSGQSIERVPAFCDTDSAADWQPQRYPTPGKIEAEGECTLSNEADLSNLNLLSIGRIQGEQDVSPYTNQVVEFRGVVTGSYEDQNADGIIFYTLFVQDVPGEEDGNPATSDGIAVFLERDRPQYQIGDVVYIKGKVTEFFGFTEIDNDRLEITHISSDNIVPIPEPIDPPSDNLALPAYFEALEGMLVSLPAARVVGPTHAGCGFAVVDSRMAEQSLPIRRDGEPSVPVIPVLHNSDVDCHALPQLKTGDRVTGLKGPLIYHFDLFKLVHQDMSLLEIVTVDWPDAPLAPNTLGQQLVVATFNLENYFDDTRDSNNSAEPVINDEDLLVKRQKLAHTISISLACPTIVAVQEVENERLLQELVAETAVRCGFSYQISHQDGPDSRGLDVALLSDPQRVQIKTMHQRQTCTGQDTGITDLSYPCPVGQSPLFGRPPLQVETSIEGQPFQFFVNHFKSKRGGEKETQGRRIEQAQYILRLVAKILTEDPHSNIVVLGDMNDYELSTSMIQLTGQGVLRNILERVPIEERYSYIFDGRKQLIDSILVSEAVESQVARVAILHINADYPIGLAKEISSDKLPYRGSDHDIPLIVINMTPENPVLPRATPHPTVIMQAELEEYPSPIPTVRANTSPIEIPQQIISPAVLILAMMLGSLITVLIRRKP